MDEIELTKRAAVALMEERDHARRVADDLALALRWALDCAEVESACLDDSLKALATHQEAW